MAERVRDGREIAGRPRFLEQCTSAGPLRRRGRRRTSVAPHSWRRPDRRAAEKDARARSRSLARTTRGRARGRPESVQPASCARAPDKIIGSGSSCATRRSTARCAEVSAKLDVVGDAARVSNASANTSGSSAASAMATCSSRSASAQLVTSVAISASLMRRRARSAPGAVAAMACDCDCHAPELSPDRSCASASRSSRAGRSATSVVCSSDNCARPTAISGTPAASAAVTPTSRSAARAACGSVAASAACRTRSTGSSAAAASRACSCRRRVGGRPLYAAALRSG